MYIHPCTNFTHRLRTGSPVGSSRGGDTILPTGSPRGGDDITFPTGICGGGAVIHPSTWGTQITLRVTALTRRLRTGSLVGALGFRSGGGRTGSRGTAGELEGGEGVLLILRVLRFPELLLE